MKPICQNRKENSKKIKIQRISSEGTRHSLREFPNFYMKETPERPRWNAIRCRISCFIQGWCQNEAQLPKKKKKFENKNSTYFKWRDTTTRCENSQISTWSRHLKDLARTPFDAEFRALFSGCVKMKLRCQERKKNWKKIKIPRISSEGTRRRATRIPKFLHEGDTWKTSLERHSM